MPAQYIPAPHEESAVHFELLGRVSEASKLDVVPPVDGMPPDDAAPPSDVIPPEGMDASFAASDGVAPLAIGASIGKVPFVPPVARLPPTSLVSPPPLESRTDLPPLPLTASTPDWYVSNVAVSLFEPPASLSFCLTAEKHPARAQNNRQKQALASNNAV